MKYCSIGIHYFLCFLLAFLLVVLVQADPFGNLSFRLPAARSALRSQIGKTIRNYNSATAGMYATAGLVPEEFLVLPAENMEKRKLYKDIEKLREAGLVMVFDHDSEKVLDVSCPDRETCIADTDEIWGVALQYYQTRKNVYNVKASHVKCRYRLSRLKGKWLVRNVEVYPSNEQFPATRLPSAL